jgi:hypothetical protein
MNSADGPTSIGITLLTGVPAGEPSSDGSYAPDTVHGRVQARLAAYALDLERYGRPRHSSRKVHSRTARTPSPRA